MDGSPVNADDRRPRAAVVVSAALVVLLGVIVIWPRSEAHGVTRTAPVLALAVLWVAFTYRTFRLERHVAEREIALQSAEAHLAAVLRAATGTDISSHDLTALDAAVRSLEAQKGMYRVLLDRLPGILVAVVDEDLRYVSMNGAGLPRGVRHDDFVGLHVGATQDPNTGAALQELYLRALEQPTTVEVHVDGRVWELEGAPLPGTAGRRFAMSVGRDVTERRGAAEALRRTNAALAASEDRFRTAFADAPIGIALVSAQPATLGRFVQVNPSFGALVGRAPDDIVGMMVEDLTYPGDPLLVHLSADQLSDQRLEKRYVHSSGRPVWVEVSYSLVRGENGEPLYFVTLVEDI